MEIQKLYVKRDSRLIIRQVNDKFVLKKIALVAYQIDVWKLNNFFFKYLVRSFVTNA